MGKWSKVWYDCLFKCDKENTVNLCGALKAWREEDLARGRAEGRDILNCLNNKLVQEGRIEDLIKAMDDLPYQNQLLQEYGLGYLVHSYCL